MKMFFLFLFPFASSRQFMPLLCIMMVLSIVYEIELVKKFSALHGTPKIHCRVHIAYHRTIS
jgi:hypothetical protein